MTMSPFVAPCLSSASLTNGPEFPSSKLARVSLLAFLVYASTLPILGQVDLNGDKSSDPLVFITNHGRVVPVRFSDARITWFVDWFSPAGTMAFGDLNGDGSLDVVEPIAKSSQSDPQATAESGFGKVPTQASCHRSHKHR